MKVTIDDCKENTFSVSGKGGQRRDHTNTGVRLVHVPSGATGEGRSSRKQSDNRREAFIKLVNSQAFRDWYRKELGMEDLQIVQESATIRTYNMVDQRVTDHRTKHKSSHVDAILDGNIDLLYQ